MSTKKLVSLGVSFLVTVSLIGQSRANCDSIYNAFLLSDQLASLKADFDTIYPNGRIYYKRDSITDFTAFLYSMYLDSNITFEAVKEIPNRLDSNKVSVRFQEYYKGIIVKGGGFTEGYYATPGGPVDRCLEAYSVSPYIFSSINLDIEEAMTVSEIVEGQGVTSIDSSQLTVSFNEYNDCNYSLTYQITYIQNDTDIVTSIFDAVKGEIIRHIELYETDIPADTRDFGERIMNDRPLDVNLTWLVSEDERLRTYDYEFLPFQTEVSPLLASGEAPSEDFIPRVASNSPSWPSGIGSETTYQSHWITDGLLSLWESEFNVEFNDCHVLAHVSWNNAASAGDNTLESAIWIIGDYDPPGENEVLTFAWPDVIAHEMTHTLLHDIGLDYDAEGEWPNQYPAPNGTLHEGISDMFGVYMRSVFLDAEIDWEYGDSIEYGSTFYTRDFSDPEYDCFTEVEDNSQFHAHVRADPLRYWFYLCVKGDQSLSIPAIDPKIVLEIILTALGDIGSDSDYEDLMNGTLDVTLERFGRCSNEFLSLARAWEAICIPTGYTNPGSESIGQCNFSLDGPAWICEEGFELDEDEYLKVCLVNAITTYHYRWTLIGQESSQYESILGMTGNSQNGGTCIELIDFPEHAYYPQRLTIKVYCPELGSQYMAKHTVTLYDCEHDDPTCDEYYENYTVLPEENVYYVDSSKQLDISNNAINEVDEINAKVFRNELLLTRVYSTSGQLLFSGDINSLDLSSFPLGQLYILLQFDKNGTMVHSEKRLVMDWSIVFFFMIP